jgi:hypothetical protein
MKRVGLIFLLATYSSISFADFFSFEPNLNQIRAAVDQYYYKKVTEAFEAFPIVKSVISTNPRDWYRINELQKIDCVKESPKSYRCNVYSDITIKLADQNAREQKFSGPTKILLMKTSRGWMMAE